MHFFEFKVDSNIGWWLLFYTLLMTPKNAFSFTYDKHDIFVISLYLILKFGFCDNDDGSSCLSGPAEW